MKVYSVVILLAMALFVQTMFADKQLPLLEEKVTYSAQGSKSESSHHYLLVDGKAIPDTFTLVWQEGRLYRFHQRQYMWGVDGYAPVKEDEFKIKDSDKAITEADTKRKWYPGKERLKDTPWHWAYVEWTGGAAFVDPIAIADLAKELKLTEIRRSTMDDYFKDK